MAARIDRCVVHIGSEKTGTTSIQNYFGKNRDALLQEGFWYPRCLAYEDGNVHRRFSDYARAGDETGVEGAFREELASAAGAGAHTAVISSEFLHSTVRKSSGVERARTFLAAHFENIRIVYYARRQDRLIVSMHSTSVRGGFTSDPSALSVYERKGHHYFDHLEVCDLWAAGFGRENLVCRIYERDRLANQDVIDDFSTVIGLPIDTNRKHVSANASLSHLAMRALILVNGSRHKDNEEMRRRLVAAGRKRDAQRVPMLTRSEAREFLQRFRESNALFFERYVEKSLASRFSEDFDEFPETIPQVSAEELLGFIFGPHAKHAPERHQDDVP
jgi:hypothetical protein